MPTLAPVAIESTMAACLLPLWDGPQSVVSLVEQWAQIRSPIGVNLEPVSQQTAFEEFKELLIRLEVFLSLLLEPYSQELRKKLLRSDIKVMVTG